MKNSLSISLLVYLMIGSWQLKSQDVIFSQFENAPLQLNSALTGNFDGRARALIHYRDQWTSLLRTAAYRSGTFSFDSKIALGKNQSIGIGVSSLVDRAGNVGFGTNQLNLHAAYRRKFGDLASAHHLLSIGGTMGFERLRTDFSKVNYLDFSAGVLWNFISNSRFTFQVGSSIHHLNRPDISVSQTGADRLYMRFNMHGNAEIPLAKRISIVPSFLFASQGPHETLIFGADGKYLFLTPEKKKILSNLRFGVYGRAGESFNGTRSFNSLIFRTSLESRLLTVGLSYDYFTMLETSAFEIVLGYKLGVKA